MKEYKKDKRRTCRSAGGGRGGRGQKEGEDRKRERKREQKEGKGILVDFSRMKHHYEGIIQACMTGREENAKRRKEE